MLTKRYNSFTIKKDLPFHFDYILMVQTNQGGTAMNLMKKMMLRMTLLILIPVFIIGYGAYKQSSDALESAAQQEAMKMTQLHAQMIQDKLDSIHKIVQITSKNGTLLELLENDTLDGRIAMENYLHNIQNENSELIEMMIFVDKNGDSIVSDQKTEVSVNVADRQYMQETLQAKEGVFSDVLVNRETGKTIVVATAPVKQGSSVEGVLVATILFDNIKTIVSDISIGSEGYGYLVNNDGLLICHPNQEYENEKNLYDSSDELDVILDDMTSGGSKDGYYTFEGVYKYVAYAPVNGWSIASTANYDDYMAAALKIRNTSIIISIAALIIAMITAYLFTKFGLIRPIKQLVDVMLEAGKGNLTVRTNIKTKDEIRQLGDTFNEMMDMQGVIISEIRDASGTMTSTAEELSASAQEVSATTEEITAKIDQISNDAYNQTQSINTANLAFNRLNDSIQSTDVLTKESSSNSESALAVAEEGRSLIKGTVTSINAISTSTDETVTVLSKLNRTAEQVSGISATINSIADSINLLALNASIEAARAGEHGRGFSVVAEEVRKLAEQTSNESGEIQTLLTDILDQVHLASSSIQSTKESVDSGVDQVSKVDGIFTEIIQSVENVVHRIASIRESAQAEIEVAGEMSHIVSGVAEMAQMTANNTQDISAGAEEQAAITETLSASAEEASAMAESLNELVRNFQIDKSALEHMKKPSTKVAEKMEITFEKENLKVG